MVDTSEIPYRRVDADRLTQVETNYTEINKRLERIEGKFDTFLGPSGCEQSFRCMLQDAVKDRVKVTDGLTERVGRLESFKDQIKGISMGISWVTVGLSFLVSIIGTAVTVIVVIKMGL